MVKTITKKEIDKFTLISGEVKEIEYSSFGTKKKLNLELCTDAIGSPCILFSSWTKKRKEKDFFVLHLKEAIELKGIIDKLIFDWNDYKNDLNELE